MHITTEAVAKLKEVISENGEPGSSLRVMAMPSDNGALQYMMAIEKEAQEEDTVITMDGLNLLVDSDSAPFLEDATIDYVEEFPRAQFVISNPSFSTGGCGCGNSGCGCGQAH